MWRQSRVVLGNAMNSYRWGAVGERQPKKAKKVEITKTHYKLRRIEKLVRRQLKECQSQNFVVAYLQVTRIVCLDTLTY